MIPGLFFKKPSELQAVFEFEQPVLRLAEKADDEPVDQGADHRTPAGAPEVSPSEEEERQPDARNTAEDIIDPFDLRGRFVQFFAQLGDKKLICLRRDVGVENHRHAQCTEQFSQHEEQDPQSDLIRGHGGQQP